MTENIKDTQALLKNYPKTISKDQFYRIAHISKATALHLLQSGLVPCKDSGKKTRRYTIRTEDVLFYLIDRDIHPEIYRAPSRWYETRSGHFKRRTKFQNKLNNLSEAELEAWKSYIEKALSEYNDLMTVAEVTAAIGYCNASLQRWCGKKLLRAFHVSGRFLIPKRCLVDFLCSQYSFAISRKSLNHIFLINEFLYQLHTTK